jgi:3-oxoacyl-[acyl-carrier protein] reductase
MTAAGKSPAGDEARVAIVTGAGRGIGRAVALELARAGYSLCLAARSRDELEETRSQTGLPPGRALIVLVDLAGEEAPDDLTSAALDCFGHIDVLVNNAGLGGQTPVADMTDDEWDRVLDVTLTSVFRTTRAALRYFRDAGHGGVIVNNASVLGWRAQHSQSHYGQPNRGRWRRPSRSWPVGTPVT